MRQYDNSCILNKKRSIIDDTTIEPLDSMRERLLSHDCWEKCVTVEIEVYTELSELW